MGRVALAESWRLTWTPEARELVAAGACAARSREPGCMPAYACAAGSMTALRVRAGADGIREKCHRLMTGARSRKRCVSGPSGRPLVRRRAVRGARRRRVYSQPRASRQTRQNQWSAERRCPWSRTRYRDSLVAGHAPKLSLARDVDRSRARDRNTIADASSSSRIGQRDARGNAQKSMSKEFHQVLRAAEAPPNRDNEKRMRATGRMRRASRM
jgi:hypothetical protein